MPNINGIINRSNIAKLGTKKHKVIDKCNCRDKVRCPLEGKCKQECVVYKVEVYTDSNNKRDKKIYFGSTQGDFKTRYYNHRTSFSHERYRYSTALSSYVWEIKEKIGVYMYIYSAYVCVQLYIHMDGGRVPMVLRLMCWTV